MKSTWTVAGLLVTTLAGCSLFSGIRDVDLVFQGERMMNPNSAKDPDLVEIRIMRLEGDAAAAAFEGAEFFAMWEAPKDVANLKIEGDVLTLRLDPTDNPVSFRVKRVDPKVTHFGVLALFNNMPPKGQARVLLTRAEASDLQIHVHQSRLSKRSPDAARSGAGSGAGADAGDGAGGDGARRGS